MLSTGPAARASIEFECIDVRYAERAGGAIQKGFTDAKRNSFAIIRIITTPRRFEAISKAPAVPGNWFLLEIARKNSRESSSTPECSLPTWHAQLQENGFPVHSRGVTYAIRFLGSDDGPADGDVPPRRSLGAAVVPQISLPSAILAACSMPPPSPAGPIDAALAAITSIASLRVRDVGQASFSSLCDNDGRALLHYDVGFPTSFNGHTSPDEFDLTLNEKPPIVLSHWDWDHLHAAFVHPHLQDCVWIVPEQRLGPVAARLAWTLASKGKLLVHPPSTPTFFPSGYVAQASGPKDNANNSGLIMSVSLSSGRNVLLTGDADYTFLRLASSPAPDILVATHHGARIACEEPAIPAPASTTNSLLLSYGSRNVYRHPHAATLTLHKRVGWTNQIATARTFAGPRGDRTVV